MTSLSRTTIAAILFVSALSISSVRAQQLDFGQVDAFESMGTGTLHGASAPKTIVDDSDQHTVIITIWKSDTDTKVYWKSAQSNLQQTTIIPGLGVQTFRTAGELKLEAVGDQSRSVNYGYVLLRNKTQ